MSLHFRDLTLVKGSIEETIQDEFFYFSKTLEQAKGDHVEVKDIFVIPVFNVIWRILTGERLDVEDPKLPKTLLLIDNLTSDGGSTLGFIGYSSTMILWILETLGLLHLRKGIDAIFKIVDEQLASHEATFQVENMRDFIDFFIGKKMIRNDSTESKKYAKRNLQNIFMDLFLAGSETTTSTLKWVVLFMTLHQNVQEKVKVG